MKTFSNFGIDVAATVVVAVTINQHGVRASLRRLTTTVTAATAYLTSLRAVLAHIERQFFNSEVETVLQDVGIPVQYDGNDEEQSHHTNVHFFLDNGLQPASSYVHEEPDFSAAGGYSEVVVPVWPTI